MKILIVEDEYNAREGLADLIEKNGPDNTICGKAADGQEGYEIAIKYKPDLVFVDIELPKMNGLEMIGKLLQTPQLKFQMPAFVILSGYAEFNYAQQAIKYGVQDYLLKPISYEKLKDVIRNLEKSNELKRICNMTSGLNQENIICSILLDNAAFSSEALQIIRSSLQPGNRYLINIYYGKNKDIENLIKVVTNFCQYYDFSNYYFSLIRECKYLSLFINTDKLFDEIEKNINYNLIYSISQAGFSDCTVSLTVIDNLSDMLGMINKIKVLNTWALTLGNEKVISQKLINSIQLENTELSRKFDIDALCAIKNCESGNLKKVNNEFISFIKIKKYPPDQIIKICTSYIFSILVCYKELNPVAYDNVQNVPLFDIVKNCCTLKEIEDCLDSVADLYSDSEAVKCAEYSGGVRKILNYISISYNKVISLEQIADRMNVTPEYLSHLFTKEVGVSFSSYLKKYRIDIAKKMMVDSNRKIYAIGKKTGYSNPKYFSKVFKEVTGLSPREYLSMLHL
jgi:two-component system, response regulator YesN